MYALYRTVFHYGLSRGQAQEVEVRSIAESERNVPEIDTILRLQEETRLLEGVSRQQHLFPTPMDNQFGSIAEEPQIRYAMEAPLSRVKESKK